METISIPATDKRGPIDVEYDPDVLRATEETTGEGATLSFYDIHAGHFVAGIPRFAADSIFVVGVPSEQHVTGMAEALVQDCIYYGQPGARRLVLSAVFHKPFYTPTDDFELTSIALVRRLH